MGQFWFLLAGYLDCLFGHFLATAGLVHLSLQQLVLDPAVQELLVLLKMFLEAFFLPSSHYFYCRLELRRPRRTCGCMELNEVVEVIERHVESAIKRLVSSETKSYQIFPHLLLLILKEFHLRDDRQVLALFDLLSDELTLRCLETALLLVGLDPLLLHVVHEVSWDLRKGLPGQFSLSHCISFSLNVGLDVDEVYHISFDYFPGFFRTDRHSVLIHLLQISKFPISNAHQHDRQWLSRCLNHLINSKLAVIHLAVSEHDKHIIVRRLIVCLCELDGHIDDLRQFGRSMRLHFLQGLTIQPHDLIDSSCDERMEVVAIESETVTNALVVGRQFCPEAVDCDLVVVVEVLQSAYDLADGCDVRVLAVVGVVEQGISLEVGVGEVYAQNEVQSGTIDDVGQKGVAVDSHPFQDSHVASHKAVLVDTMRGCFLLLLGLANLSQQGLQDKLVSRPQLLMRILFVKPEPKASVLLCWELTGCYFQRLKVDLRFDICRIRPRYRNPLILSRHLNDEVHNSLTRKLGGLQLHFVLQVPAIVLTTHHLQHTLLLCSGITQRQSQLRRLIIIQAFQFMTSGADQALLDPFFVLLAVVNLELYLILFF